MSLWAGLILFFSHETTASLKGHFVNFQNLPEMQQFVFPLSVLCGIDGGVQTKQRTPPPLLLTRAFNTTLSSMTLGFMNGQHRASLLAESGSQSVTIVSSHGGSGWMDKSSNFRGQALVSVPETSTPTYLVCCRCLYIAVGNNPG